MTTDRVIPDCQGHASWRTIDQAQYVADGLSMEFGTDWVVVTHGDHYHAIEATG